jgi:adenylosuccinate synthase
MPAAAILGAQWGDEGKGKVVDLLSATADLVVRFQGGPNAGHTIVHERAQGPLKVILHHVPSGLLHDGTRAVMGRGMVVDPTTLLRELLTLREAGYDVTPARLHLSWDAHVVLPAHRAVDAARESSLGDGKIGTTLRGVGPTYEDRTARRGLRFRDLRDDAVLAERLERLLFERNALLAAYGHETLALDRELEAIHAWRDQLLPFCADTHALVQEALEQGQRVLAEGAQGALLDLSLGTYPYVTSSHTTTGGLFVGCGIGPAQLDRVLGVTKAYATRVGRGPFPSELHGPEGHHLATRGHEFGATTGRPRRCGWLDLVALRHAARLCGLTSLAVTKLDVLGGLERVGLVTAYEAADGTRTDRFPDDPEALEAVRPVVLELPGWNEDLRSCARLDDLPAPCRTLLEAIEEATLLPLSLLSVGPSRTASIALGDPLWEMP